MIVDAALEARSHPVSVVIGPAGGSLLLAGGARVEADSGAFVEETQLTITIVDIPLAPFAENPPDAVVYALSTEQHVKPLSPVVLEIPLESSDVRVRALVDGAWKTLEVPAGPTTRIEFDHFSGQLRFVMGKGEASTVRSEAELESLHGA